MSPFWPMAVVFTTESWCFSCKTALIIKGQWRSHMETYCMWCTAWEYMLLSFQDCRHQFHPPQFLQNLPAMDNELDTHDTSQGIWNM